MNEARVPWRLNGREPANGLPDLWGGHECTVNRVGDRWHDQTRFSGHQDRPEDLDRFAELGLTALRYPVLWERVSPDRPDARDFAWEDERLERLRALRIRPIVGLIHHGSGPRYTGLLDDEGFASGLAAHARATAERYPWVTDWTPVNEPVTTARFACLYGVWHPHAKDERLFWRAVLNEIDATRLAMREIRGINAAARLIQTDDLGHAVSAGPDTDDQAEYENHRRWIGWDLLQGRVIPGHPLWDRIAGADLGDRLRRIADDPCPPDVIGINHYLSSERLIERALPGEEHGGDGANTVSRCLARHARELLRGPERLIGDAWARYGATIAVTEVHNGCTREEQLRWFERVWHAASQARAAGADVEAVTAWALLGSQGWDKLVTDPAAGGYEPGVFDVRAPEPRPTAIAGLLRRLAGVQGAAKPVLPPAVLRAPGWWEQGRNVKGAPPILITGRTGTLGQRVAHHCALRGLPHVATDRRGLTITEEQSIAAALDRWRPWAVINTAGVVDIDLAEREPQLAQAVNADAPERLAKACAQRGIRFVTISTDQVFDGAKGAPYVETDPVSPLNVYGRTKAEAEKRVLAVDPGALVIRTAAFFSPHDPHNFAVHAVEALLAGRRFAAAHDSFVTPTYVPDLADAMLDLLIDGETGIWHVAGPERLSWTAFARRVAEAFALDPGCIDPVAAARLDWHAPRPADVALGSERGRLHPGLSTALDRFRRFYIPQAARAVAAE